MEISRAELSAVAATIPQIPNRICGEIQCGEVLIDQ